MDDPTHILIWIFIFGLMVVLGSLLCLVARQWRRMGETRRRERGLFGTSVGRAHISARTLANRERVLELWDSSRLGHGTARGGRLVDPFWQVTDLESSPTSSLADSIGEQLPGRRVSTTPEASVRPGPFRLLTSPLSSSGPVLGVVRILGSPATLFVASTGRSTRRHITMPGRPTTSSGWSERLGEIDVWCPALPFGQLLANATPPSHAAARSVADGAAASPSRGSRSAAAAASGRSDSTRNLSVSDEELAFVGRSAAASASTQAPSAATDAGAADAESPARAASEEEAAAVARGELAASGLTVSAEEARSLPSSSSRSPVPWAATVVKLSPQQPGQQQQQQGAASETSLEASGSGCAICIEDFVDSSIVRALPCGHVFHRLCLDSWFERSSVCPLCLHDYQQAWRRSDGSTSDTFCPPTTSLVLLSFRPLAPRGGAASAAAAGGAGRGSARSVLFPSQSSRASTVGGTRNSASSAARSNASSTSYPTVAGPSAVTYYRRAPTYQNYRGHRASRNSSRGTGNLSAHPISSRQRLGNVSPAAAPLLSTGAGVPIINSAAPRSLSRRAGAVASATGAAGPAADVAENARNTTGAARETGGDTAEAAPGAAVSSAGVAATAPPLPATATSPATAAMEAACLAAGRGATPAGRGATLAAAPPGAGAATVATSHTSTLPPTLSEAAVLGVATDRRTGGVSRVPVVATPAAGESPASAAAAAATAAATSEILFRESTAHAQNALSG